MIDAVPTWVWAMIAVAGWSYMIKGAWRDRHIGPAHIRQLEAEQAARERLRLIRKARVAQRSYDLSEDDHWAMERRLDHLEEEQYAIMRLPLDHYVAERAAGQKIFAQRLYKSSQV